MEKLLNKRMLLALLAAALLCLCLGGPALAADRSYVFDETWGVPTVGPILSESELDELEAQAARISQEYDCGLYIMVIFDYRLVTSGSVRKAAETLFTERGMGLGEDASGVLLMLSMEDRDYALIAHGYGNVAFTDYGKEVLVEKFLDNFRRDDWMGGFTDYLSFSEEMLRRAEAGEPLDIANDQVHYAVSSVREELGPGVFLGIFGLPCLIALIVCQSMKAKMKSVRKAGSAAYYQVPGSLQLYAATDHFTHTTQTRVRIESDSDRGGGGGGSSVNSGGFSGTSGKF